MAHPPEKPKYPLKKVEKKGEGLVEILENNFGSLEEMNVKVKPSKEVVEEVVEKKRNEYFNKINEYLKEIKEKISTIGSALEQIEGDVMIILNRYFPGAPKETKKIVEILKEHKDVVLRDRQDLDILWELYKKEESRIATQTEKIYTYTKKDLKYLFAGGDAISKETLRKYADTIKNDIRECLIYWFNLSKECPVFGLHSDNLILFKTLKGTLSVINKNLEELRSLESVNKDDLKPVHLTINLINNIKAEKETIMKNLNSNFQKLEKEFSKNKN